MVYSGSIPVFTVYPFISQMPLTEHKLRERLRYLYIELEDVFLYPICMRAQCCLDSCFSSTDLRLSFFRSKDMKEGFPITHIVKALGLLTLSDDHIDTLSKIVHARQTPWPPSLIDFKSLNETQIFAIIVDKILCLVAETVTVEVQYAGIVAPSPQIRFARNGMGDPLVWHGFSDAFLNTNTSVHSWNCEAEMDEDSEICEAEESSVCAEGKREKNLYLSQLVTSAVINSFTEANTKHYSHPIPSILINGNKFQICLYDSNQDILLLSSIKTLGTKGCLSRTGLFLMWLVSHHR